MKKARQIEALAQQRRLRQVMKGLRDIDAGRVASHEEAEAEFELTLAIAKARQATMEPWRGYFRRRRARSWFWMPWKQFDLPLEDEGEPPRHCCHHEEGKARS